MPRRANTKKAAIVLLIFFLLIINCSPARKNPEHSTLYKNISAIMTACEKYSFSISWALAVFFIESSLRADAVKWEPGPGEDAIGLGQPLLSTAQYIRPGASREDLLNPEYNADVCVAHLSNLLKKHSGNYEHALREYNGGNNWKKKDNRKYYIAVKHARDRILTQKVNYEKYFIYGYYFIVCSEFMGKRLDR